MQNKNVDAGDHSQDRSQIPLTRTTSEINVVSALLSG